MRRVAVVVLLGLTLLIWAAGWGKREAGVYGDPLLAKWQVHAAEHFADHGLATYGLPVYTPGGATYTHLTPGPEWIQAIFALLRRLVAPSVDPFLWHSIFTTAMSIALLFAMRRAIGGQASSAVLLLATTPSFVIHAPNPACAGALLANVLTFASAASWVAAPRTERWPRALMNMAAALFAAFWLGGIPLVSGLIWTFSAAILFGEPAQRLRRCVTYLLANGVMLAIALALKLLQSLLVLGSFEALLRDHRHVLAFRTGQTVDYPLATRLRDLVLHSGFLFGLALLLLLVLLWRSRPRLRREAPFFAALLIGALAWQVLMPGHVKFHPYWLRELMVPLTFMIAMLSRPEDRRAIEWCALASIVLTAALLVVPLVIAGLPLWKL